MTQTDGVTAEQPDPATSRAAESVLRSDTGTLLAGILDAYLAELHSGKSPDRGELLAAHPALATQLEACLAGIEFVHRAAGPAALEPATLGEFQIVRELGRGGMGVVYEADQTSLRRRVALKVLRFGAVADLEAMRRFRREAETVARLHHTNIVPIFAVGCERDVHYYAMQFIEGQSLADVLAESRRTGKLLSPQDVAGWGRQAAEALAHAHQRGVIHRDIKPSNLLLDPEGIVWLTDFGLAKRADLAALTVTGALMGTPRYMSPEQAESLKRPVDHRTDLYSLGATLYELATGQPVFESATPHGVIARILTEQPARPRQVRPGLPRDLETIILSCLAKEPSQRYQTALALADDLRAVLDGRPIRARRTPLHERITRYVRKRSKTIGVGAIVVAATSLAIVGSFLAWRSYSDSRLGRVLLSTDGPPLEAQVLSASVEERVGEPFSVGTHAIVSLPEDKYRLRVGGPGILSQTYQFGVGPGELGNYHLAADENRLLGQEPIPYAFASEALLLSPGKADLVEWTGTTLIRRDGVSGRTLWDASRPAIPWEAKHDPVAWMQRLSYLGDERRPGVLVQPAPDLDGDGTADIVWAFRGTPSLLALSGKDGSMLWTYSAEIDGRGGLDIHGPAWPHSIEQVPRPGAVLGSPALRDVDGDFVPDLIAAFVLLEDVPPSLRPRGSTDQPAVVVWETVKHRGRRVVLAVSGRSGRALWVHPIDQLAPEPSDCGVMLMDGRNGLTAAFVDGARGTWIGFNPANGQSRGQPIDFGFAPVRPVQHADLDGDGEPEILALGPSPSPNQQTLAAFSCGTGRRLWTQTVRARFKSAAINPPPNWPAIVDVDGDGRSEILVADSGALRSGDEYRGARLLNGASGADRWARPLHPKHPLFAPLAAEDDGLAQVLETADLDGDGTRDLVAVSRFDGRQHLEALSVYVDMLSGKDGHSLWWWHSDFKLGHWRPSVMVWTPFLWGRGADGWPMLAVPLGGTAATWTGQTNPYHHREPPRVHLLSLTTGRELHSIDGLSWPRPADLDGDGLADLWGSVSGNLRAYRGQAPEAWRALGRYHKAGDLDGDGISDVVSDDLRVRPDIDESSRETLAAVAHSGRDGKLLWRRRLEYQGPWIEVDATGEPGYTLSSLALPGGDLDGDGAPEISVVRSESYFGSSRGAATLPLEVLSGRSGRPLWSAGALPLSFDVTRSFSEIASIDVIACEPHGPMDFIVRHHGQFVPPGGLTGGNVFPQDRLARLSGRDGHVIWDRALADLLGVGRGKPPDSAHAFVDCDGDGYVDIFVLLPPQLIDPTACQWRAVSLRDGKTLWSHATSYRADRLPIFEAGDLDGDGRLEFVRNEIFGIPDKLVVTALDSRDGSTRWSWYAPGFSGVDNQNQRNVCLADFEGKGASDVCVAFPVSGTQQRVVILDATGHERASREVKASSPGTLIRADLDGDGADELLFRDGDRLCAVGRDLENRWFRPTREAVREVIPSAKGQPAVVVLDSMIGSRRRDRASAVGRARLGHGA